MSDERGLTNHEITIALEGGAVLGPFRATWSTEIVSDVRELTKDYDAFLRGERADSVSSTTCTTRTIRIAPSRTR